MGAPFSLLRRAEMTPLPLQAVRDARQAARVVAQFGLLLLLAQVGGLLVERLGMPLPGNLAGLLLLLALLWSGAVRPSMLEEVGGFLLKHLVFFFIPFAVGLITQGPLFATSGVALVVSLVGGAVIGIATAGTAAQIVARWRRMDDAL